jgi:predicted DNA-binding transcriptional regulator YafY
VLGPAWVARRGDPALARGARDLVAKLSYVMPREVRPLLLDAGLKPVSFAPIAGDVFDGSTLRAAIRSRNKLSLVYKDRNGTVSERTIWPILIAPIEDVQIPAAWCEKRKDFRHFRTDRIRSLNAM